MEATKPKRVIEVYVAKICLPFYKSKFMLESTDSIKVKNKQKFDKNVRKWAEEFYHTCEWVVTDERYRISEPVIDEEKLFKFATHKVLDEYGVR